MKLAVAAAALVCFAPLVVRADAPPKAAEVKPVEIKGAEVLAMEAGTWDADITFPSREAGKPDEKAHGVQVNELRSGGMWMLNRFSVDDTPYEGTGVWGYDRATDRYSGIWVDNNDQQIRFDDGLWDPQAKTITWTANQADPKGRYMRLLTVETFAGDTRTFESVALTRKGEVPLVRIKFTRRAPDA